MHRILYSFTSSHPTLCHLTVSAELRVILTLKMASFAILGRNSPPSGTADKGNNGQPEGRVQPYDKPGPGTEYFDM